MAAHSDEWHACHEAHLLFPLATRQSSVRISTRPAQAQVHAISAEAVGLICVQHTVIPERPAPACRLDKPSGDGPAPTPKQSLRSFCPERGLLEREGLAFSEGHIERFGEHERQGRGGGGDRRGRHGGRRRRRDRRSFRARRKRCCNGAVRQPDDRRGRRGGRGAWVRGFSVYQKTGAAAGSESQALTSGPTRQRSSGLGPSTPQSSSWRAHSRFAQSCATPRTRTYPHVPPACAYRNRPCAGW